MDTARSDPQRITDDLIRLLEDWGTSDYIGESISQLEHCLQCAYFGAQAGSDDDTIIAALLYDIGQFLPLDATKDVQMAMGDHSVGRVGHERIGEKYLKSLGFGEQGWKLVGSHVAAKRYITAVDSSYYDGLSEASKQSLKFQGGPFKDDELESFERVELKDEMIKLRKWDDRAKIVGIEEETPRAGTHRDIICRHLEVQRSWFDTPELISRDNVT